MDPAVPHARHARAQRDAEICRLYMNGLSLAECGAQFGLKRQRIKQIVKKAGIWRETQTPPRRKFLGINISEDDKTALRAEAIRQGISMSEMTAEWIKERLEALREKEEPHV